MSLTAYPIDKLSVTCIYWQSEPVENDNLRQWFRCSVFVVLTIHPVLHSWLINGCVTKITRRMLLVEETINTLTEHLSSCPDISHVRVNNLLRFVGMGILRICIFMFNFIILFSAFWHSMWYFLRSNKCVYAYVSIT